MRITILLLILIFTIPNKAQIEISFKGHLSKRTPVCIDSVFLEYSEPKLDKKFYEGKYELWNDIVYFCDIRTSMDRKVRSIEIYPINKEKQFSADDPIWIAGEEAIREVSRDWVFKSPLWKIDSSLHTEIREELKKFNKKPGQRPFSNQTSYFLIIRICNLGLGGTNSVLSNIEVDHPKYSK